MTASASPSPVLVTDCTKAVQSVGGKIWLLRKTAFGFLIRAEIGHQQVRVVVPLPKGKLAVEIPQERNSALHIVQDTPTLRAWLQTLPPHDFIRNG